MSAITYALTPEIRQYLHAFGTRENDLQKRLREETSKMEDAEMQISPEQGQFMQLLVKLMGAKRCIEVGVFTGYSTLCTALALPPDGKIIACDISEQWTAIGRRYWQAADVAHKIDLRLAPAVDTLQQLLEQGQEQQFDFAFIDADKTGYDSYYEYCLQLIRPGGLIVIDNTLWEYKVADPNIVDANTNAIQALNAKLRNDERVEISLLPLGDGVTLAYVLPI